MPEQARMKPEQLRRALDELRKSMDNLRGTETVLRTYAEAPKAPLEWEQSRGQLYAALSVARRAADEVRANAAALRSALCAHWDLPCGTLGADQ